MYLKIMIKKMPALLFGGLFLALSSVSLADDGLTPGPGLFTGSSGEVTLFKTSKEKAANSEKSLAGENTAVVAQPKGNSEQPATTYSNTVERFPANEFELYKQWRQSKDGGTSEYQEFKYWVEYQEYLKKDSAR